MGVRITGISTPIGGVEWEYTEKKEHTVELPIIPDRKIQVFISSICGDNGRYDNVRAALKKAIEDTGLAQVYTFEGKESSVMTAKEHYTFALENSDVCIFLIDNADGITPGVQSEIDTVKKCNIKALYYFCDETEKQMTAFQKSLLGADNVKSKTVHSFDDLDQKCVHAVINDIVMIYIYYCHGNLIPKLNESDMDIQAIELNVSTNYHVVALPKTIIENIDRCKDYILRFTLGFPGNRVDGEKIKTSELDGWAVQFLPIMFEGKSIKSFNTGMFLDTIKEQHEESIFKIVEIRWKAIQSYFLGDVGNCISHLSEALTLAKKQNQSTWVIQDILIDLRNQQLLLDTINNNYSTSPAQKELDEGNEIVYYPALDRINESLHEKYLAGLYKKKTESPYTVTWGSNLDQFGALLASALVVSLYNGSLTHLLIFYEKIKDFLFYLCSKYDDWRFRKDLLKLAIFGGKDKDVKDIRNAYPEVLNEMSAKDANDILAFCENHPIAFQRFRSQLIAFGAIGYYLDEDTFNTQESKIISGINDWLKSDYPIIETGQHIFNSLTDVAYRIPQDTLAGICCLFMEKRYSRWYTDLFKFMSNRMNLNKMSEDTCKNLIQHIYAVLDDESERKWVEYQPRFLYVFRKQNREATNGLDERVRKYFPIFYEGTYKLETTTNPKNDYQEYLNKCIERIRESNNSQGKNGTYFEHGTRDIATIRNLLLAEECLCDETMVDKILSVVADTLILSKEGVVIKLDAISLMICIAIRFPEVCKRNSDIFDKILQEKESIEDFDNTFMSSNVDKISLRIALALLNTAIGREGSLDFLEGVSIIQSDKATILSVSRVIMEYLETDEKILLPKVMSVAVLQNALQWLQLDNLDIKYTATRILLMLSQDKENEAIVNQRVISLIDNENVYLKNLILRRIFKTKGIYESTKRYAISKCQQDPCSVVRMVCKEVQSTEEE